VPNEAIYIKPDVPAIANDDNTSDVFEKIKQDVELTRCSGISELSIKSDQYHFGGTVY